MGRIRVLLIDDNPAFLEASATLLMGDPAIDLVGTSRSPKDAVGQVSTLCPDVVLLDLEMAEMIGLLATLHIKAAAPAFKIVIVADNDEPIYQKLARAVHADAFISKRDFFTRSIPTIQELAPRKPLELLDRHMRETETVIT